MIELLEPRRLFSVDAFVHRGTLIIRGSDGNDTVSIFRGDHPTSLQLSTSTDGEGRFESLRTFTGVRRGIRIDTGAGDDLIQLQGLRVFGSIQIDGGAGDDQLIVRSTRPTGVLIWRGGAGDDSALIRNSTIQRDLVLGGGPGRDRTYLSFVHVRDNLRIEDTDGPSVVIFTRLSVDGDTHIATSASADTLTIHDSTFKREATITTSRGDDRIRVRGTIFRQTPLFDPGEGDNQIDREIILEWDFNNGAQGWEAGFADFPYDRPLDNFRLRAEIRSARALAGLPMDVYELSGENLSDDLLMYLSRELSSTDGLISNKRYRIEFTVQFLSERPQFIFGHTEYLKVGAVGHPIARFVDPQTGDWNINLDRGNQATGGRDASVIGLIHNGLPEAHLWRKVERVHVHSGFPISDQSGRLWLFVGAESAFESHTAVWFTSISVKLTPVGAPGATG